MKKKIAIMTMLAVLFLSLGATAVLADAQTQIISPVNAYHSNPPGAVIWNQTLDVTAAQVNISEVGGSWQYNSGPIYMSPTTTYVHLLPASVIASMPRGKSLSVYVENYHYTGGVYTGFSSDQLFFAITP
jgi:hypothetical protein